MANENSSGAAPSARKTIADIIAEKRELADALESATSRDRTAEQQETIDDLRTDADRLEAAWKRELGNAAAMREALELLNQLFDSCVLGTHSEMTADEMEKVDALYFKAKAALASPPRNCDIYDTFELAKDACHADRGYCQSPLEERKSVIRFMLATTLAPTTLGLGDGGNMRENGDGGAI